MRTINFTKPRTIMLIISILLITGAWIYTFAVHGGFNFGIDFRPGLILLTEVKGTDRGAVESALDELNAQVQSVGSETGNVYNIRISEDPAIGNFQETMEKRVLELLGDSFGENKVEILSQEFVGARSSSDLSTDTVIYTLIALILILVYIWIRFKLNYSVSAILAIFHDVLFLLGFIGVMQLEFSVTTIAAVLTIIGYSLNDTIVIFDRIRENTGIVKDKKFHEIINISVTQSLTRTLMTSVTTLLAAVAIAVFASGTIRIFGINLIVGVIVGTYSSIFIASNVLLSWHNIHSRRVHDRIAKPGPAPQSMRSESPVPVVKDRKAPLPVQQTAEEIAEATARKRKQKAKKKKKKK